MSVLCLCKKDIRLVRFWSSVDLTGNQTEGRPYPYIIGDENMIQEMLEEFNKVLEVQRSWQK